MLALLPLTAFLLFLFFSYYFLSQQQFRFSFLYASIIWGGVSFSILELLSLGSWLTQSALVVVWAIIDLGMIIFLWKYGPKVNFIRREIKMHLKLPSLKFWDVVLLLGTGVIVLLLAVIAFVAPPNNWDSMTYHMSRVVHWHQNHSVNHYPTNIFRQLNYTLWPEYAITHFYVLMDSDRLANFIQWFAMIGSMIGSSLIVRFFGGTMRQQIMGSLWVLTLPMGILQATSTQTDLVVGFWILCFVCFLFDLRKKKLVWVDAVVMGVALGLGFLTKGNGYLFAIPFLVWFLVIALKRWRSKGIVFFTCVCLSAVLMNAPYFARNLQLTGVLVPPSESSGTMSSQFGWQNTFLCAVYNLSAQLYTPWIPWNRALDEIIRNLTETLHGDLHQISFGEHKFGLATMPFHEDHASNMYHFVFYWIAMMGAFWLFFRRKISTEMIYLLCIIMAGIIFISVVKWAPWHSRYHLPLFVLMSPLAVMILSRLWGQRVTLMITIVFLFAAMFWVCLNQSRTLWLSKPNNIFSVPRHIQYFKNRPELIDPMFKVMAFMKQQNCFDVGLKVGEDTWEYPLWTSMKYLAKKGFRIEHVFVDNNSKDIDYSRGEFSPCGIVMTNNAEQIISWSNQLFVRVVQLEDFNVYLSVVYARRLSEN